MKGKGEDGKGEERGGEKFSRYFIFLFIRRCIKFEFLKFKVLMVMIVCC